MKYNANVLSGLLSNFDEVEKGLEAALDSTGSAAEENARYLDSVAGKAAQLQSAFEQLSNSLLNSDLIKFFLDLGIGVTDAANGVVELTGALPLLAAALTTIASIKFGSVTGFSAFSQLDGSIESLIKASQKLNTVSPIGQLIASFGNLANSNKYIVSTVDDVNILATALSGLNETQQSAALSMVKWNGGSKEVNESLKAQLASTLGLTSATGGLATAQGILNTALGVTKSLLLGLGIGAIVTIISAAVQAISELIVTTEEAAEKATEAKAAYDDQQTTIESLTKRMQELSDAKASAHTEEELAAIDAENQKLEAQLLLAQQLAKVKAEEANKNASRVLYDKSYSVTSPTVAVDPTSGLSYNTYTAESMNAFDYLDNLEAQMAQKQASLTNIYSQMTENITDKQREELEKQASIIEDQMDSISKEYTDTYNTINETMQSTVDDGSEAFNQMEEDYEEASDDYVDFVNTYEKGADNVIQKNKESVSSFENFVDSIKSGSEDLSSSEQSVFDKISNFFGEDLSDIPDEQSLSKKLGFTPEELAVIQNWANEYGITVQQAVETVANSMQKASEDTFDFTSELEKQNKQLDTIQENYQIVRAAIDEYNQYGQLSADTYQKLNTLSPEYVSCLFNEQGQLNINSDTLAIVQGKYTTLTQAVYENIKALKLRQTIENIEALGNIENAKKLAEQSDALKEESEGVKNATTMLDDASRHVFNQLQESGGYQYMSAVEKEIKKQQQSYLDWEAAMDEAAQSAANNIDHHLGYTPKIKDQGKEAGDAANKIKDYLGAWSDLYAAMEEYNTYGTLSYNTIQSLLGTYPELTSCLQKEGDELTINADALKKLIENQLEQIATQEDATNTASEYQRLLELVNDKAKDGTLTLSELKDMIEGVGTSMDESQSKAKGFGDAIANAYGQVMEYDPTDKGLFDRENLDEITDIEQALKGFSDEPIFTFGEETKQFEVNINAISKATTAYLREQAEIAKEEGDEVASELYAATANAIERGDQSAIEYWTGLGKSLEYANSTLDTFQSAYNDLSDITEEYNQNHELSQDSWQKLMAMGPEYIACLEMEGDKLVFNKEAYKTLYKAQIEFIAGTLEALGVDQELVDKLRQMADGLDDLDFHFGRSTDKLQKYKDALSSLENVFNSVLDLIQDGLGDAQDALEDASDNLQIYGDAIINEIDDRIDALEDLKDAQDEAYQNQIDALEDLKEAQEDANEEVERAVELAKLQDELARARANRTIRKYVEGQGYIWTADDDAIRDAEQNLSDQQREWANQDAQDAIDDEIDKIEEDQQAAQDAIDDQIEKLEELKDKYSEVMDLIGMDWDEYQAMLKAQAEANGMTLEEMEASLDNYKDSIVSNMKEVDEVTDTQEQIDKLQNFIEKLKDVWAVIEAIIKVIDVFTGGSGLWGAITDFVGNLFGGGDDETTGSGESGDKTESTNIFETLLDNTKNFFEDLKKKFKDGWDNILEGASEFNWDVYQKVTGFFGDTKQGVQTFVEGVKKFFTNGWENITQGTGQFFQGLLSKFEGGFPNLSNIADNFIQTITGFFTNGFPNLSNIVQSFFTNLPNIFTNGLSGILSTVTGWFTNLGGLFSQGLSSLLGGVTSFVGNLGSIGSSLAGILGTGGTALAAGGAIAAAGVVGTVASNAAFNKSDELAEEGKPIQSTILAGLGTVLNPAVGVIKGIKKLFGFAKGTKGVKKKGLYQVDEKGPELIVRSGNSGDGRYTYLEKGDGVIPADITKNLFEVGKNPSDWFNKQLRGFNTQGAVAITNNNTTVTIGDIIVNKPIGDSDQLARAIVQELPNKMKQELNKR